MTVVIASVSDTRGRLIADTLTEAAVTGSSVIGKLSVVPHLNAAAATRGRLWHSRGWYQFLSLSPSLAEAMKDSQAAAVEICRDLREKHPDVSEGEGEFICVGWDRESDALMAFCNLPQLGYRCARFTTGTHSFPPLPGYPRADEWPAVGDIVADHRAALERNNMAPFFGGDWIEAVVSRDGISTRNLGVLQ